MKALRQGGAAAPWGALGALALAATLALPAGAAAPVPGSASSASSAASASVAPVWVWRSTGGRQCEPAPQGASLADHRALLQAAQVVVLAERCASDGRMRVAMCGAADGRLNVFQVPRAGLAAAQKAGFQPLAAGSNLQFQACP